MAKTKQTKATKAKQAGAAKPARRPAREQVPTVAAEAAQATAPEGTPPAAQPRERVRDPRLPPPGTVIEKRDRQGAVRCKCTVEEDGIRYEGTLYKSLSAAAMAAAKDLGIGGRSQNGYTFWGLSKPPRPAGNPLEALGRAWERYRKRATSAVASAKDDDSRARVKDAITGQANILAEIAEAL